MDSAPRNLFFYELCRLCLENEGACDVFETNELLEDILACTGVKMSASDNLPRKICGKCSDVIKNWKHLRLLASRNDINLKTLFGSNLDDDDSDCDDIIKLSAVPSHEAPAKPDASISLNTQNSSKQKLSMLLESDEENKECFPVIRQTISLRNDLFPPSTQEKAKESQSPIKKKTDQKETKHDKLLRLKVEEENRCKKVKLDSEEIEYVCPICCKGFDKYKKLYLHQRLHNKKVHCPLDACGKKFATKGDLQKHMRTHTGEKPFLCKMCDKRFTQRVSLRSHMSSVHADIEEIKLEDENGDT